MGKFCTLLLVASLAVAGYFLYPCFMKCGHKPDVSQFRLDGYFGATKVVGGKYPADKTDIRPFKLNVSDSELQDLQQRLANARYVDHVEETQFRYGFNSDYLRKVVEYWRTKYDFRAQEKKLNSYPMFVTQIEGLDIHFVHVKPSKQAKLVIPLMAVHGWPGSFYEYHKSLALLTEPINGVAFEVIVPSIPGYGFSEAPHKQGFNGIAAARVFVKLMKRLGHERFFVHGGDWGNLITRLAGIIYPENVRGVHLLGNFLPAPTKPCQLFRMAMAFLVPSYYFGPETAQEEYGKVFPLSEKFFFLLQETGYMHIQGTKPDTVASGLVDSPVGLAAYILEKFAVWTNPNNVHKENGGLTEKFTMDELLTNVMIYWTSGNIAASQRFYKENMNSMMQLYSNLVVPVPAGTVDVKYEFMRAPQKLIEKYYSNLLQYSSLGELGHFTAFEHPKAVTDDIRSFVHKVLEHERVKFAEEQARKVQESKSKKVEM